jgi:hypothetical protein
MSVIGTPTAAAGLPVANRAVEPAWVRNGSRATQKTYETALAFEATLVEQLSRSLAETGGLGGEGSAEGESGSEAGSQASGSAPFAAQGSQIASLLPQALSDGVMRAGGLGLAAQLTREQQAFQGDARPGLSGGAAAPSGGGTR